MRHMLRRTPVLLAGLLCSPAWAAESYQGCTGFINAIPTTISTPGTWCLRTNFSTLMTSGAAITVNASNVVIDGNGFYINGLEAGAGSTARGIHALNRVNVTVRDVRVRGFYIGVQLSGGAGYQVEDNLIDLSRYMGINVTGDANRVQGNRVLNTGGATNQPYAYAIYAEADVIDNFVSSVSGATTSESTYPRGIYMSGVGTIARDNFVRGVEPRGAGSAKSLWAAGTQQSILENQVTSDKGPASVAGWGILGSGTASTICRGNDVVNHQFAVTDCDVSSGDNYHY